MGGRGGSADGWTGLSQEMKRGRMCMYAELRSCTSNILLRLVCSACSFLVYELFILMYITVEVWG